MSTTPPGAAARPEPLKVLDQAAKNGGDTVSPGVRASAALNTPESNVAVKHMTADKGTTMQPFVGANGDCTIADNSAPKPAGNDQAAQSSHTVKGEIHPETTVGNDTQYAVSATGNSALQAKNAAGGYADNVEQAA
ncbi:MAG TPA: hypothetical protein V6C69_08515 [Trichormus sp.]|jgi:hypothetical protein